MKTNRFSTRCNLLAVAVTCLLSASALQAQTFTGQEKLSSSPKNLEASIYPVTTAQYATMKVNFNNRSAGGVLVVIRDETGNKVYEQFETIAIYRQRFDLSSMPAGHYTIELSKKGDHFSQAFTIEPPSLGHITMVNQPVQKTPEIPVDKKLIVSH